MSRIEIGAGTLLAIAATFGFFESPWAYIPLAIAGVALAAHGAYEEWIKPSFRVGNRIADWLLRRAWHVQMTRREGLAFHLSVRSGSSGHEVIITRDQRAYDDKIHFTASYIPPSSQGQYLDQFDIHHRNILLAEIRIYLSGKTLGFEFVKVNGEQLWPPIIAITSTLAQDRTLTQQSVDEMAHSVELSIIGIRAIVTKVIAEYLAMASDGSSPAGEDEES